MFLLLFVAFYFLLILLVTLVARYYKTGTIIPTLPEFLLANRDMPKMVLSATFFATFVSAAAFIALPGHVYVHGIGSMGFVLVGDLAAIVIAWFFYKRFRAYAKKEGLFSPVECLSKAYKSKLLGVAVGILAVCFLIPFLALQLVGVGFFLAAITDGSISYANGVGFMVLIVCLYVIFGGMRAIAYTDTVQTVLMIIGFLGGFYILMNMHWDGFHVMVTDLYTTLPEHFSLPGPQGLYTPLYFLTACFVFAGIAVRPEMLTRALMARDDKQIRFMLIYSIILIVIFIFFIFLYGVVGYSLYEGRIPSNQFMGVLFLDMMRYDWLSLIVASLFLVGLLGASMSTADSMLMATAKIVTRDFVARYFEITLAKQVLLARFTMAIVILLAYLIGMSPPALMLDLALLSISASCALLPAYLGFEWRKRSSVIAIASIILAIISLLGIKFLGWPNFGLHEGFICLAVAILTYYFGCQYVAWRHKS